MIYALPIALLATFWLGWIVGYNVGKGHGRQDAKIEERGATLDAHFTFHPQRCQMCGEPCRYTPKRGWHCLGCDISYAPKD